MLKRSTGYIILLSFLFYSAFGPKLVGAVGSIGVMRGAHCHSGQRDLDLYPGSFNLEPSALATELSHYCSYF